MLVIDRRASVQFREPFLFRLIRVMDIPCTQGWLWLDGYELGQSGDAVQRRELFVQVGGLRLWLPADQASRVRPLRQRATGNAAPGSYGAPQARVRLRAG